nr:homoserine kinase [Paenibacillus curdlanolyticus]
MHADEASAQINDPAHSDSSMDRTLAELIGQYDLPSDWRAIQGPSGMNNTTRIIACSDGQFVLRIYNNHQNAKIVKLEHEVLQFLLRTGFSLKVPDPVTNRNGDTITVDSNGKLASLFRYIEGERPSVADLEQVESLGRAAGMLSGALEKLPAMEQTVAEYRPYYELAQAYEGWSDEAVLALAYQAELPEEALISISCVLAARKQLQLKLTTLSRLPHQWIHGDLNASNAVAIGRRVTGILDFEFCTIDLRAMEPAVAMVDFIRGDRTEAQRIEAIERFARGFGHERRLGVDETAALPDLMLLRMLDVFLHFAVRLSEGLDDSTVWIEQAKHADAVIGWVDRHRVQLHDMFRETMSE